MDESFITKALADQWPMVTVILLTFFRSATAIVRYLKDLEGKFDSALRAQVEHGRRIEQGFDGIAQALRQGVIELRERTDRHSRDLGTLGSEVSLVKGRLDDLERSAVSRPPPLRPVQ